MNTVHRDKGRSRRRALMLAAVVAVVLVLVGAAAIALSSTGNQGEVIAADTQPAETVLAAPTTSPPATVARTTTAPPTTVPPTTPPPTTVPAPQVYDATLTWDGETCTFDGPTEARVGDSLTVTGINTSLETCGPNSTI